MERKTLAMAMAALYFGLGPAAAHALDRARVAVDFEFVAGETTFPAGQYDFSFDVEGQVSIRRVGSGQVAVVPLVTHLSPRQTKKPLLVFDKEGNRSYLSEIYLPGTDGYCLRTTRGKHTHVTAQSTD